MVRRISRICLVLVACILVSGILVSALLARKTRAEDYEIKYRAALHMEECMKAVKGYKENLNIPISKEDLHQTGMIGADYTLMTTTMGAPEAKRTTANPDMAALVVELLEEAGVKKGDTVAAGFSGSFPAMNLAVLCACEAMDAEVVFISSAGASTYGANQPELTFPDMVHRLAEDGLLSHDSNAVSVGGDKDLGLNMDPEVRDEVAERLESYAGVFIREKDYQKNLAIRREIYEQKGTIACFIGVGGHETTSGLGETQVSFGLTKAGKVHRTDGNSGLLDIYNKEGIPVIQLLNIKKLVADYGLPYDPEQILPVGESDIFYKKEYPVLPVLLAVAAAIAVLCAGRLREDQRLRENQTNADIRGEMQ